jgi:hypothetical protein
MQEREVKRSQPATSSSSQIWAGCLAGVTATPKEDESLSTTYLDSDGYRLARWA